MALNHRILSTFPSESVESLPELCNSLLLQQQSSWPWLINGYAALQNVRVREIQCGTYPVFVQFNPQRIVSSGAKVDPESIGKRRCFLCLENLPEEQKGILYRDDLLVLGNPAPIVDRHLTIAHVKHIPQAIEGFIPLFLDLAQAMSPVFTIFYNGPKCGASAPDHMHFQACPTGVIPIEREAVNPARRKQRKMLENVSILTIEDIGRQNIIIECDDALDVQTVFKRLILVMKEMSGSDDEPMINALCSYYGSLWRIIVFPRRKHRPDVFFKEGNEQVLISPAAVDIGGLVVTPIERDFDRVDAQMIQHIFDEVMLDNATVEKIIEGL